MQSDSLNDLVLRSLEHERTGIEVYEAALRCALTDELRREWEQNLTRTRRNERMLAEVCDVMDIDLDEETAERRVVRQVASFLVEAMQEALETGNPETAEIVACECVVLAEAGRYRDWPARTARMHRCARRRPRRA